MAVFRHSLQSTLDPNPDPTLVVWVPKLTRDQSFCQLFIWLDCFLPSELGSLSGSKGDPMTQGHQLLTFRLSAEVIHETSACAARWCPSGCQLVLVQPAPIREEGGLAVLWGLLKRLRRVDSALDRNLKIFYFSCPWPR